jgi:hypothetical protein
MSIFFKNISKSLAVIGKRQYTIVSLKAYTNSHEEIDHDFAPQKLS